MKVFITGGSGLFGQYLNIELSKNHKLLTQYNSNIGNCDNFQNIKIDLNDYINLVNIFDEFKPDFVIHTAAISNPTASQQMDSRKVYEINVIVTEKIARLCDKHNSKMIYISTDLVYAGYRGSMLTEEAKLIPVSLYAETKLMGEIKMQQTFDNYIILRTALLYGFGLNHSKTHFDFMYSNLKQGKEIRLFIDQFRTPLSLNDAARMMNEMLESDVKSEIINFGGVERISRYELGERLCEISNFDKNLLVKINMNDVPDLPKVEDVSLNTDKLHSLGIKPKSISDSIKEITRVN
jgi:dTDP-4-dehydrorhamnose reductase